MKQVIGKMTTTIQRDVVFEVADDVEVKDGLIKLLHDPQWPNSATWISLGAAVDRGLARVVFDGSGVR